MKKPRIATLLAVLLVFLSLAAGLVPASAKQIKIGVQPWLGYGPWWIAEKEDFFAKHGLDVKIVNFTWDADMGAAVSSGRLDVICAATNFLISLKNQNLDLQGFLILDAAFEADAILAPKSITSIKDLAGKSVAYEKGATSDLLINYALKENGMSIADIKPVGMAASDAGMALIAGRVDLAVTYEPYISAALKHGDTHHVLYTAAERPGLISDLAVSTGKFIKENPDTIRRLILAWDDAVNHYQANPETAGKIIADAVKSPMDEFLLAMGGVKLYNLKANQAELAGDFQKTVMDIARIMKETNPKDIKMIPAPEETLAIETLMGISR